MARGCTHGSEKLGDKLGVAVILTPHRPASCAIQGSGLRHLEVLPGRGCVQRPLRSQTPEVIIPSLLTSRAPHLHENHDGQVGANKPEITEAVRVLLENGTPLVTTTTWEPDQHVLPAVLA